jgi:hypothetical protein
MTETRANAPVVAELGKKKRGQIKKLRKGEGPLMDDVFDLLEQLRGSGRLAAGATPVVVIVKQKSRQRRGLLVR